MEFKTRLPQKRQGDKGVILITGSSGLIGTKVAERLGRHYSIVGFELLKAIYASPSEELVPLDLASDESVHQAFQHIRYFYGNHILSCVHLAAYYSFHDKTSPMYDEVTVKGTERILRALQSFEVEQFVFSSSMLVHAPCKPDQKITEESPLLPKWAYPQSKVITERLIREQHGDIPYVNLRIAGVYDDDCRCIPLAHQIRRIYEHQMAGHLFSGNLSHGASFVHLDDVVDAIELAVEKRASLPKETTLLIGESKTLSYGYLQKRISKLLFGREIRTFRIPKTLAIIGAFFRQYLIRSKKVFIRPWMIPLSDDNYTLDVSKAKQVLGWAPKHSLDETLPKMVQDLKSDEAGWYRRNNLVR